MRLLIAFHHYDDYEEREDFLGVFSSLEQLERLADQFDPDTSSVEGSSICYYDAELDRPGDAAVWVEFRKFEKISAEEATKQALRESEKKMARILENRKEFFSKS